MSDRIRALEPVPAGSAVMDHAQEFVDLVGARAPGAYRKLLAEGRFRDALEPGGTFNHGKLFVYAEFLVFQREFRERFPEASDPACINAFAGLFLKNDISIHNLVEFIEGKDDHGQLRLNSPDSA